MVPFPPDPVRRYGPQPPSELVVQSEDVLVNRRGYIYVTDKNQGLWILERTTEASPGALKTGEHRESEREPA